MADLVEGVEDAGDHLMGVGNLNGIIFARYVFGEYFTMRVFGCSPWALRTDAAAPCPPEPCVKILDIFLSPGLLHLLLF